MMLKKISFVVLLFLCQAKSYASHIVGGDFNLQQIDNTHYVLNLEVFRDCEHGIPPFNNPVWVGMFRKEDDQLVKKIMMKLDLDGPHLKFTGKNCINIPTGCTEIGYYSDTIILDPNTNPLLNSTVGYYFSWERCCRNVDIKNIFVGSPPGGNTGMTFYMEIPPLYVRNSTPVFNKEPLTLLCTANPFSFNYNVTDADGDSLVYSIVTPLQGTTTDQKPNDTSQVDYPMLNSGPYKETTWKPGYSLFYNIMDARPNLTINKSTGQLDVTPMRQGIYVVSILVEEWRNGVKLGNVRRELQFTISTCLENAAPVIQLPQTDSLVILNAGDSLCFDIPAHDPDRTDSVYINFLGDIFSADKIKPPFAKCTRDSGLVNAKGNFCWQTGCQHISADTHLVTVRVYDNGCPLPRNAFFTLRIVVKAPPKPLAPDVVCLEKVDNNTLRINWKKVDPHSYVKNVYLVKINPDKSIIYLDTFNKFPTFGTYLDNNAYQHELNNYCYFLCSDNICGMRGDSSYKVCSDPDIPLAPDSRELIRATVENNSYVHLDWEKAEEDDFLSYNVYRKTEKPLETFSLYATIFNRDQTYFNDSSADIQNTSYCYKMVVADKCGYSSLSSNDACTIVLSGTSLPFEHNIKWNDYKTWNTGVENYSVFRRREDGPWGMIQENPKSILFLQDTLLDIDYGAYWYKVIANRNGDTVKSQSNELFLIQKPLLHVPNAFTPNGDNLNDDWRIVPVFVKDYRLKIFNRWGERVYDSNDKKQQWKGYFREEEAYNNIFIYQIMYTGWDKSTHYTSGNVTILR